MSVGRVLIVKIGVGKVATAAAVAVTAASAVFTAASPAGASPAVTTVVSGLASPRGIVFDGLGSMYVAQAGVAGPEAEGVTQTGNVSKYDLTSSGANVRWSTPFTSVYDTNPLGQKESLGPAGLSAMGSGCQKNSPGNRRGCQVLTITDESVAGLTNGGAPADTVAEMGKLVRLDSASGAKSTLADVGDQNYAWTGTHSYLFPPDFPDANPYAVLVTKGGPGGIRTFVADAGANTIDEILPDGTARVISYIPNETSPGFRDSTPTCIAEGPDGMLYVGTLDLLYNILSAPGFGPGHSNVWKVDPNSSDWQHNATLWASGLTTVGACTFDNQGNFWAAEMFAPPTGGQTMPGDLVKFPFAHPVQSLTDPNAQRIPVPMPGGVAQGPDGAVYATTMSPVPAPAGAVVRITAG
jgi:hypothetical protein